MTKQKDGKAKSIQKPSKQRILHLPQINTGFLGTLVMLAETVPILQYLGEIPLLPCAPRFLLFPLLCTHQKGLQILSEVSNLCKYTNKYLYIATVPRVKYHKDTPQLDLDNGSTNIKVVESKWRHEACFMSRQQLPCISQR